MKSIKKISQGFKVIAVGAALVFTMVQCSEQEIAPETAMVEDATTQMMSESAEVASISVTGLYTEIAGDVSCAACAYVVDSKETTVDGKVIGIKPGDIVCLKKGLKYGAIDFVNMEGTAEKPITIGYCGN